MENAQKQAGNDIPCRRTIGQRMRDFWKCRLPLYSAGSLRQFSNQLNALKPQPSANRDFTCWLKEEMPDLSLGSLKQTMRRADRGAAVTETELENHHYKKVIDGLPEIDSLRNRHSQHINSKKEAFKLVLDLLIKELEFNIGSVRTLELRSLSGECREQCLLALEKASLCRIEDITFNKKRGYYTLSKDSTERIEKRDRPLFEARYQKCRDIISPQPQDVQRKVKLLNWVGWDEGKVAALPSTEQAVFAWHLALAWAIRDMTFDLSILNACIINDIQAKYPVPEIDMNNWKGVSASSVKPIRMKFRLAFSECVFYQLNEIKKSFKKFRHIARGMPRLEAIGCMKEASMGAFWKATLGYVGLNLTKFGKFMGNFAWGFGACEAIAIICQKFWPNEVAKFLSDDLMRLSSFLLFATFLDYLPKGILKNLDKIILNRTKDEI